MELNELTILKNEIDTGASMNIMDYIRKNNVNEKPVDVRQQLIHQFGMDDMRPIFEKMRQRMTGSGMVSSRLGVMIANRFVNNPDVTVQECDSMIAALNSALSEVQAKKASLIP